MADMEMDLDLDDVDLDDVSAEDMDLGDFGNIDENIDEPHIKVASKTLKDFLKVAKRVCSSGGKDIISKAVCLHFDEATDRIIGYATDFDVYVEVGMECLNTENILREDIIVLTDILIKMTSAVGSNTIFYKKDDKFFIRLAGGDMELETHQMNLEKFQFTDEVQKVGSVEVRPLYSCLKDFTPIVSAAVNPIEKRILVQEDGAYATYMFAILRTKGLSGDCDLKTKDIEVLKLLTTDKKDETLSMYRTVESVKTVRQVVEADNFKYAFLISGSEVSQTLKNKMKDVIDGNGYYLDFLQFYKMIDLAAELPYTTGKVGLNFNDDGVALDIKTKSGASNMFNISGSVEGDPKIMKNELLAQAGLLRLALKPFQTKQSIKLSLNENGIGIECDDYEAVVYSEVE